MVLLCGVWGCGWSRVCWYLVRVCSSIHTSNKRGPPTQTNTHKNPSNAPSRSASYSHWWKLEMPKALALPAFLMALNALAIASGSCFVGGFCLCGWVGGGVKGLATQYTHTPRRTHHRPPPPPPIHTRPFNQTSRLLSQLSGRAETHHGGVGVVHTHTHRHTHTHTHTLPSLSNPSTKPSVAETHHVGVRDQSINQSH